MKTKKNHIVKTSGLISLLGLVGVTGLMIFWPWGLNTKNLEVSAARSKAEIIAYQIVQIYKEANADREESTAPIQARGLASVKTQGPMAGGVLTEFKNQGSMGIDPWGRPYQYRIVGQDQGDPKLIVWSLGANGVLDDKALLSEDLAEVLAASQVGDDIRIMKSITESDSN